MKVVIATNNKHKVGEIETAVDFPGWEFDSVAGWSRIPSPRKTPILFVGNALTRPALPMR